MIDYFTPPPKRHRKGVAPKSIAERFWPKVQKSDGCWLWTANKLPRGYGVLSGALGPRRNLYAHRISYEIHYGPIPTGLTIDHLCRNPPCVRPDHLEAVTNRENHRRGKKAQQTHCLRGHPLSGANVRLRQNGTRNCKACDRSRQRRRYREGYWRVYE